MAAYEKAGESDEWYTPKYIFDALGLEFDMDVASPYGGPRYVPAKTWYSCGSLDGLWRGLVWMNPPFGHQSTKRAWSSKFLDHGNGIALFPDRCSAPWWQEIASKSDAVCFVSGKIKFEKPNGEIGKSPGTGTCLFSVGIEATQAVKRSNLGHVFFN